MDTMKDGVELINAKPVPRPGRWVSAIIVAILAAMAIHGLVTNKNYQWNVVFQWLFSQSLMQGVAFTIILTVLAMVIGTVLAITMAIWSPTRTTSGMSCSSGCSPSPSCRA